MELRKRMISCLNLTSFVNEGTFYHLGLGRAMSSLLSAFVANLFVHHGRQIVRTCQIIILEKRCLMT